MLEHKPDLAIAHATVRCVLTMKKHSALVDDFEPGNDTQEGIFPEPDGPNKATNSPVGTWKLTSCSAVKVPKVLVIF